MFCINAAHHMCVQSMKGPYSEWAQGHIDRMSSVLNAARTRHTQSVKDRITGVEKMKDVVSLTQDLFAASKETAQLEGEIFVQRQKVALAAEVKSVLDSWVRYEQQAKESEQAELAKSVIANVLKSIQDEKAQRDILAGAVAEVEREC
jgi:F-type H+-transporting ATPase subunit b